MCIIGCHLSVSKGYLAMGKTASSIGANTFQFFSRNPRGGAVRRTDPEDADALAEWMKERHFGPILCHAPYTLNPCSSRKEVREFALRCMTEDLDRLEELPCGLYNFHPGSHTGQGTAAAIPQIADTVNQALSRPGVESTVLLETMAGKGTEVGRTFEELADIISRIERSDHIGVCLDTCHVYDSGYDIAGDVFAVLDRFDEIIGLDRLRAVHLNDDKNPMGSHKDRHERIGYGSIGTEAFARIINEPRLRNLPFFLETPNELSGYAEEIALLRSLYKEE